MNHSKQIITKENTVRMSFFFWFEEFIHINVIIMWFYTHLPYCDF